MFLNELKLLSLPKHPQRPDLPNPPEMNDSTLTPLTLPLTCNKRNGLPGRSLPKSFQAKIELARSFRGMPEVGSSDTTLAVRLDGFLKCSIALGDLRPQTNTQKGQNQNLELRVCGTSSTCFDSVWPPP